MHLGDTSQRLCTRSCFQRGFNEMESPTPDVAALSRSQGSIRNKETWGWPQHSSLSACFLIEGCRAPAVSSSVSTPPSHCALHPQTVSPDKPSFLQLPLSHSAWRTFRGRHTYLFSESLLRLPASQESLLQSSALSEKNTRQGLRQIRLHSRHLLFLWLFKGLNEEA